VATTGLLLVLCCLADAFVLRSSWTGRQIAMLQVRRGYFEPFADGAGLALDAAIRPLFPNFLLTERGALAVPPGASAIAPLTPGTIYELQREPPLAPYVVVGIEAALTPGSIDPVLLPGEARLAEARTLSIEDGRLALVAWEPTRPWRDDAARLTALRTACAAPDSAAMRIEVADARLSVRYGRCAFDQTVSAQPAAQPLLAALAGVDWLTMARSPEWVSERWFVWPVLGAIAVRVAATWWGVGLAFTVGASALLALASLAAPIQATLTWPVVLAIGLVASAARAAWLLLGQLPTAGRLPAAAAALILIGGAVAYRAAQPDEPPPIMRLRPDGGQPEPCALIGYSTAQGASLRRGLGGIRYFLDRDCAACRDRTGALAAGGETLAWLRRAFGLTPSGFGSGGTVIFLGGANDDFFSGMFSLARLFVIGEQGIEPWRHSQAPAAAASRARLDTQADDLGGVIAQARARQAQFVFLHDFLISDLVGGRDPDRAAMLARRREVVNAAGGRFVDLLDRFGAEAGVAWFNDYVHPSAIGHARIGELACGLVGAPPRAGDQREGNSPSAPTTRNGPSAR
jgi:hypothetical protein